MNRPSPPHIDELDGLSVGLSTSGLLSTGTDAGSSLVGSVITVSVGFGVGDSLGGADNGTIL